MPVTKKSLQSKWKASVGGTLHNEDAAIALDLLVDRDLMTKSKIAKTKEFEWTPTDKAIEYGGHLQVLSTAMQLSGKCAAERDHALQRLKRNIAHS